MKNLLIATSVLLVGLMLKTVMANQLDTISPQEAYGLFTKNEAIIVDVREKEETDLGKIKGTILMPLSLMDNPTQYESAISQLSKDKKILVYCRSGRRSGIVGADLAKRGFTVLNLKAFADWKSQNLPVE